MGVKEKYKKKYEIILKIIEYVEYLKHSVQKYSNERGEKKDNREQEMIEAVLREIEKLYSDVENLCIYYEEESQKSNPRLLPGILEFLGRPSISVQRESIENLFKRCIWGTERRNLPFSERDTQNAKDVADILYTLEMLIKEL